MATAATTMTTDDLLSFPEDGMERWLIAGELRERPMTKRNRFHSACMTCTVTELENWRRLRPPPRGLVLCGEAGVILRRDPDTTVGVDVAYVPPELLTRQTPTCTIVEGVPLLMVEILSPNDTVEEINEKIDIYLAAGVAVVWVIDPFRHTVTIYRSGSDPVLIGRRQELSGEPELPGFRVPVARLFE